MSWVDKVAQYNLYDNMFVDNYDKYEWVDGECCTVRVARILMM